MALLDITTTTLIWPVMLWSLLALPLAAAVYWRMSSRQRRAVLRYASLAIPGESGATGVRGFFRRHGAALLVFAGLAAMLFAIARPQAMILLPARVEAVMLAMDISGSMRATDVKPSRLEAAQEAARSFIAAQPARMRIGVVTVAGTAALAQAPTENRDDLRKAIENVQLQRGTALGSGIVIALANLLPPGSGIDAEKLINGESRAEVAANSAAIAGGGVPKPAPKPSPEKPKAVAEPGSNNSAVIVLLTDGQSNTGPDPVKMAELAAQHGVRIFTVGVGTSEGATLTANGWSMRVRLDEEPLKKIAQVTRGEYFRAASGGDLKKIYDYLGNKLRFERHQITEVTGVFVALGALLALLGVMLSMLRFNRVL